MATLSYFLLSSSLKSPLKLQHGQPMKHNSFIKIKCQSTPIQTTALTQDDLKKLAAVKAVEYVKSDMVLGLGTGSTAAFVVSEIGALLMDGKLSGIIGVPTYF